jgi:hypothetical protein
MPLIEFDTAPQIALHVAHYWGTTLPADLRPGGSLTLPADGCIALVSQRTLRGDVRAALIGPRAESLSIPAGAADRFWGVRFWPDSGGLVLGEDPERLAGHFVQPLTHPQWAVLLLRALADCRDAASAAEVADRLLGDVIASASAPDAVARQAVQALIATHGEIGIAEIAEGMGISLRQLERRFSAAVGLDPIQFGRIRKMKGNLGPLLGNTPRTWNEVLPILLEARP